MEGSIRRASSNETCLTGSVHQNDVDGMCIESVEDLLQKLRELHCKDEKIEEPSVREPPKLERTASLPPLSHHQLKPETQQLDSVNFEPATRGGESSGLQRQSEQENALRHPRSRSHGESDYRSVRRQARRERRCGRCGGGGGAGAEGENRYQHSSRKRSGRSRSDGKQRDSGGSVARVDPSLDDDCPGVLQNRVRRYRHHQHLCKQCSGVGATAERGGRGKGGGAGSVPTSTGRKGWDSGEHPVPPGQSIGSQDGPTLVMTLEDVQRAALLLEKSTEFVESGEEEALLGGDNGHTPQVYPQTVSALLDSASHGINPSSTRDDVSESGRAEADYCWRETPYTSLPSRSGRDSPATDMAVACLDMNSERMLRPLNGSRSMEWRGAISCQPHLHLHSHSHHHYHHIIHHHSQP